MSGSELERLVKPRHLPAGTMTIDASENERFALAKRFGVAAVHSLHAEIAFDVDRETVLANGTLTAEIEQPCAITTEDFRYGVTEPLTLRFIQARAGTPEDEIELTADELDEIEYTGESFDLGEAIAQTLGLAIDPYREGPNAAAARKAGLVSSEEASGPFGALAALKK